MGEFTTRVRSSNPGVGRYRTSLTEPLKECTFDMDADYIYSWRSRRSSEDLNDRDANTNVGIKMPRTSGSLSDRLADRKRFSEDIDRTMGGLRNNGTTQERLALQSKTDTGHPFTSIKFRTLQTAAARSVDTETGTLVYAGPVFPVTAAMRPTGVGGISAFLTSTFPSQGTTPTSAERNVKLASAFSGMRPQKEIAKISETLFSLIRGEFPSILKNLQQYRKNWDRLQDAWKRAPGYAGGEYLNSVFGWAPMIRDYEAAIKVLSSIDYLIFGSSYQRHRVISWDSKFWSDDTEAVRSTVYNRVGINPPAGTYGQLGPFRDHMVSYDIRMSARLVPIARPGIGSNRYVREAGERLEQLGIWYPSLGWDILPYSWLIDWFTNLGASLTNAYAYGVRPGQINLDYCWATACAKYLVTSGFNRPGSTTIGKATVTGYGRGRQLSIYKDRFPATPFGFGLDLSGLNAGQVAILVALGLVRRR